MHFFLMMSYCLILSVVEEWNGLPYKVVCFSSLQMARICVATLTKLDNIQARGINLYHQMFVYYADVCFLTKFSLPICVLLAFH
jgi:hypothetical protein